MQGLQGLRLRLCLRLRLRLRLRNSCTPCQQLQLRCCPPPCHTLLPRRMRSAAPPAAQAAWCWVCARCRRRRQRSTLSGSSPWTPRPLPQLHPLQLPLPPATPWSAWLALGGGGGAGRTPLQQRPLRPCLSPRSRSLQRRWTWEHPPRSPLAHGQRGAGAALRLLLLPQPLPQRAALASPPALPALSSSGAALLQRWAAAPPAAAAPVAGAGAAPAARACRGGAAPGALARQWRSRCFPPLRAQRRGQRAPSPVQLLGRSSAASAALHPLRRRARVRLGGGEGHARAWPPCALCPCLQPLLAVAQARSPASWLQWCWQGVRRGEAWMDGWPTLKRYDVSYLQLITTIASAPSLLRSATRFSTWLCRSWDIVVLGGATTSQ